MFFDPPSLLPYGSLIMQIILKFLLRFFKRQAGLGEAQGLKLKPYSKILPC